MIRKQQMIMDIMKYLDHPLAIAYDIRDKRNSFLLVIMTLRTHIK